MASLSDTARRFRDWVTRSPIGRVIPKAERGATSVEYGLIVVLIAAVVIIAVALLGQESKGTFDCTVASIETTSGKC